MKLTLDVEGLPLVEIENEIILWFLEKNEWCISKTAKELKMSLRGLHYKVKQFRSNGYDIPTYLTPAKRKSLAKRDNKLSQANR
jgi:DNA-binding NtrC family response regulator